MAAEALGPPDRLVKGYEAFRANRYAEEEAEYRRLASGQSPQIMIVACSDSRVDPATIFAANPGEFFVVRNVANLVPRYGSDGVHHGTSAGIEYAVKNLKVEHIVVMGHAQCGGIAACLKVGEGDSQGEFIDRWVALAEPARKQVAATVDEAHGDTIQRALECAAIVHSIQNLRSFPFIDAATGRGDLSLHGAWFSIASGELYWLDGATGRFTLLAMD